MHIDLHNHTPFCNHATGEPSEYLQKAIEKGVDIFGFSCHAPMDFDPKYRMSFEQLPKYLSQIRALRDEFKAQIDVRLGLEVDFIAGRQNLLDSRVLGADVDYLIGSVHFLSDWGFDNPEFLAKYKERDIASCWLEYLDSVAQMARSGHFDIVGHFDLLKVFNNPLPQNLLPKAREVLEIIKAQNMALEINSAGFRKPCAQAYPSVEILKIAKELEIAITFCSDAHCVEQVAQDYEKCRDLALSVGFTHAVAFENRKMQIFRI